MPDDPVEEKDLEETPEDDDADVDADEEEAVEEEEEEGDQASLEALLAQRSAARRAGDDTEEDTDIMALTSERVEPLNEPLPERATPVKGGQEFVCNSCHLVKQRVQLADEKRGLCRDCV